MRSFQNSNHLKNGPRMVDLTIDENYPRISLFSKTITSYQLSRNSLFTKLAPLVQYSHSSAHQKNYIISCSTSPSKISIMKVFSVLVGATALLLQLRTVAAAPDEFLQDVDSFLKRLTSAVPVAVLGSPEKLADFVIEKIGTSGNSEEEFSFLVDPVGNAAVKNFVHFHHEQIKQVVETKWTSAVDAWKNQPFVANPFPKPVVGLDRYGSAGFEVSVCKVRSINFEKLKKKFKAEDTQLEDLTAMVQGLELEEAEAESMTAELQAAHAAEKTKKLQEAYADEFTSKKFPAVLGGKRFYRPSGDGGASGQGRRIRHVVRPHAGSGPSRGIWKRF